MSDPGCELGSLRDELVAAASTISRISQGLSAQVVKTNQDSAFLKARISDLEAERASTALHLRRLEAQNTELRQLLDQGQPELICALEARDAALKKLHLMRELARDLLDERRTLRPDAPRSQSRKHTETETDSGNSAGTQSWTSFKLSDEVSSIGEDDDDRAEELRKKENPPDVAKNDPSWSGPRPEPEARKSSESKSAQSAQGAAAPAAIPAGTSVPTSNSAATLSNSKVGQGRTKPPNAERKTAQAARPSKQGVRCEASRSSKPNPKSGRVHKIRPSVQTAPTREVPDTDSPSKKVAPSTQQDVQTSPTEIEWYIEYQRPPATAIRPVGLSLGSLAERLGLDDDTMIRIESLEDSREPGLRLYIHRDMAFVYHPIVLEGPATTYLISWGNTVVNANIKRYLTEPSGRPADGIYHLLVKNTGRDIWYYLGRQQFAAADLPSVWHTWFNEQNKRELAEALHERWTWPNAPHAQQIARLIETREVAQCSIELRSDTSLQESSQAFAGRLLQG